MGERRPHREDVGCSGLTREHAAKLGGRTTRVRPVRHRPNSTADPCNNRPAVLEQRTAPRSGDTGGPHVRVGSGPAGTTVLERDFPFRELSLLIEADRRTIDPVYGAHRWWARRPPALIRGVLLAASLRDQRDLSPFWDAYQAEAHTLAGVRVYDPFAGGGSTLVEAARLGAVASGGDIDPLAIEIIRHELEPPPASDMRRVGTQLLAYLSTTFGDLYPELDGVSPLHYFWLHEVDCPTCGTSGLLYQDLTLVRDTKRPGGVARDAPLTVFCPIDRTIHELASPDRIELRHCGRRLRIDQGTFRAGKYRCQTCGSRATHAELQTGISRRVLIAVEEAPSHGYRRLRSPDGVDQHALSQATNRVAHSERLHRPTGVLSVDRRDERPRSYGIESPEQLYSDRQLLVLGSAFAWVRNTDMAPSVRRALTLALTNASATNNKLCGYATDYGRLAALFSVRGYALPALAVELNPLNSIGGRGTIRNCLERVARSASTTVKRHRWSTKTSAPVAAEVTYAPPQNRGSLRCVAADVPPDTDVDICFFDPPYYDYIAYDELSEFYRSWLDGARPAGASLHPTKDGGAESFGRTLGASMKAVAGKVVGGGVTAFTYHSANSDAWRAVGIALDEADLVVTAIWPVRSDGHMGHHSHPGNCEWDLLVVCRRRAETMPATPRLTVRDWVESVRPLVVRDADLSSMALAIATVSSRFATPLPPKSA